MENQNVINETNTAQIKINKVLYTGKVTTSGGRDGVSKSDDEKLNIRLTSPGLSGNGTNPEQLLAAGWSACFIGAMRHNAAMQKIELPENTSVYTEIDLAMGDTGFMLQARLDVQLPGLSSDLAKNIVAAAHQTCPYSKATHGNINVAINVAV